MQVVAILEAGAPLPFALKAAELDLPELQGEPDDIARDKCRLAAQQVIFLLPSFISVSMCYTFLPLKQHYYILGGAVVVERTCPCEGSRHHEL